MLSRRDIQKELFGNGLSLYPFNPSNIKENSINVTISKYAWCQGNAQVYWYGDNDFSVVEKKDKKIIKTIHFTKGSKSIFTANKRGNVSAKSYLLLLPHQATIVETEEVIGIGNRIGGAVHSKVGIVAQGVGDTGTMLGPGYCGHLLVTLHNITDDVIVLKVGSTFVSLTFSYLNTEVVRTSTTSPSHFDRLLEHGCKLDDDEKDFFSADWKSNLTSIQEKMYQSVTYKAYKKQIKKSLWKEILKYINKRNIIAVVIVIFVFILLYYGACRLDLSLDPPVWVDRFWNVGCSGLVGTLLIGLWRFLRNKK